MNKQIILRNITYFDVDNDVMNVKADIIIENCCIKKITNTTDENSDNTKVIDCSNKYAVPGLFESHAHLCHLSTLEKKEREEFLEQFIKKGITQVRDVGGPFNILKKMKEEINSGKIMGPEIFYSGPMLEKSPLKWEANNKIFPGFTCAIDTKEDVDNMIQSLKKNKVSQIKTFNHFDPEVYKYFVKQAKKLKFPITHDPGTPLFNSISMDLAIDFGIKCIEHGHAPLSVVLKESIQNEHDKFLNSNKISAKIKTVKKITSLGINSISMKKLHNLAEKMVKKDVYLCPTLTVYKSISGNNKNADTMNVINKLAYFFTQIFIDKKVKILVGTDTCFPDTFKEIHALKNIGLSEKEIIKGATKYPADWLNISDKYGSIKANRKANLLIVNENPLVDIKNLEKVFLVVKDGLML